MSDTETAHRALTCLDLTDLSETCSAAAIEDLCTRALTPLGPVAAICIWPQYVGVARERLRGSGVAIATVINFPGGGDDIERVIGDTEEALADGAAEIDLVMPYGAYLAGDPGSTREMIAAVHDVVGSEGRLKVILETGALASPERIRDASRLAIEAGADFIKTSTGKIPVSATPEAAEIMLSVIRDVGGSVGFKAAGGIRTLADAALYLDLAARIMGPDWVGPNTFRIGASGLYDVLIAALRDPGAPSDSPSVDSPDSY